MMLYRYIHLSDIHFGQEKYGDKPIHEDVRNELLRDCADLSNSIGHVQGILVTGDVAFSGKRDQYRSAGEWLDQLTDISGCTSTSVSVIPGNHDIDVTKIGATGKIIHQTLRTSPLLQLDAMLNSIAYDKESNYPLLPKLASYREFSERYGCGFISPAQPMWEKKLLLEHPNKLCFLGMTSVMVSDLADAVDTMVLGNQQYIVNRQDCTEFVVLMHHPVSWFRDHESVDNYLKRARVVLVGHEHSLRVRHIKHEDGETLWIYAGATNSPEGREPYQYRYNWIEFAFCTPNGNPQIEVKIFPRVWDPGRTRFIADNNLLLGNECMVYHLSCPRFQLPIAESAIKGQTIPEPIDFQANEGEVRESMNIEVPFIRLRYLFWKYLDWSERLKVLVELDILPPNLTQPIPQTMERLALENARKDGKLPALWDAVMRRIPENQREPNPF